MVSKMHFKYKLFDDHGSDLLFLVGSDSNFIYFKDYRVIKAH